MLYILQELFPVHLCTYIRFYCRKKLAQVTHTWRVISTLSYIRRCKIKRNPMDEFHTSYQPRTQFLFDCVEHTTACEYVLMNVSVCMPVCLCSENLTKKGWSQKVNEKLRAREKERICIHLYSVAKNIVSMREYLSVDSVLFLSLSYMIFMNIYTTHYQPWTTFAEFILLCRPHTCVYECI